MGKFSLRGCGGGCLGALACLVLSFVGLRTACTTTEAVRVAKSGDCEVWRTRVNTGASSAWNDRYTITCLGGPEVTVLRGSRLGVTDVKFESGEVVFERTVAEPTLDTTAYRRADGRTVFVSSRHGRDPVGQESP